MKFDRTNTAVITAACCIAFIAFILVLKGCTTTIEQTCTDGSQVKIHERWSNSYTVDCPTGQPRSEDG